MVNENPTPHEEPRDYRFAWSRPGWQNREESTSSEPESEQEVELG